VRMKAPPWCVTGGTPMETSYTLVFNFPTPEK
jgi:hypothetical protein